MDVQQTEAAPASRRPSLTEEAGDLIIGLFLLGSVMIAAIRVLIAFYYWRKRRRELLAELQAQKLSVHDYSEAMKAAVLALPMHRWGPKISSDVESGQAAPPAAIEIPRLESVGAVDGPEPGDAATSPESPSQGSTARSRLETVLHHISELVSPTPSDASAEAPAPLELPAALAADVESSAVPAVSSRDPAPVAAPAAAHASTGTELRGAPGDACHRTFDDDGECTICMAPFEPGDELRTLRCGHTAFHATCIDAWLLSQGKYAGYATCPLCKAMAIDVRPATAEAGIALAVAPAAMALVVNGVDQANLSA